MAVSPFGLSQACERGTSAGRRCGIRHSTTQQPTTADRKEPGCLCWHAPCRNRSTLSFTSIPPHGHSDTRSRSHRHSKCQAPQTASIVPSIDCVRVPLQSSWMCGSRLPATDQRRLRRHNGHELYVGVERPTRHVDDHIRDVLYVHRWLDLDRPVGLRNSIRHAGRHRGCCVADVDLAAGDVIRASALQPASGPPV
jgi:hypothetical protein